MSGKRTTETVVGTSHEVQEPEVWPPEAGTSSGSYTGEGPTDPRPRPVRRSPERPQDLPRSTLPTTKKMVQEVIQWSHMMESPPGQRQAPGGKLATGAQAIMGDWYAKFGLGMTGPPPLKEKLMFADYKDVLQMNEMSAKSKARAAKSRERALLVKEVVHNFFLEHRYIPEPVDMDEAEGEDADAFGADPADWMADGEETEVEDGFDDAPVPPAWMYENVYGASYGFEDKSDEK